MLEATAQLASEHGPPFFVLDVAADEELRGPFLLFRSLLSSPQMASVAREARAGEPLDAALEAISGRSRSMEGLSQEQMLRTFDEVATTILALTRERPVLLMLDDLQWADDDSIQLIRYLVRTMGSAPLFLLISLRYSDSSTGGASKLIADLDRMRVTHVLRLQRLTERQSGELLQNLLGAPADESTVNSLHSRSEGVPSSSKSDPGLSGGRSPAADRRHLDSHQAQRAGGPLLDPEPGRTEAGPAQRGLQIATRRRRGPGPTIPAGRPGPRSDPDRGRAHNRS